MKKEHKAPKEYTRGVYKYILEIPISCGALFLIILHFCISIFCNNYYKLLRSMILILNQYTTNLSF